MSATHREPAPALVAKIEQALGVNGAHVNGNGFTTKPIACPVANHADDDSGPAAHWNPEKKILHCFKCDRDYLTIELADALGFERRNHAAPEAAPIVYQSLADYAAGHGVSEQVFIDARWQSEPVMESCPKTRQLRPALEFVTKSGPRYRFIDGGAPKFKSKTGHKRCWYGDQRAVNMASVASQALILTNGEPSVVVAQSFNVPALAVTSGEKRNLPDNLLEQLKVQWTAEIIIALDSDNTGRKSALGLLKQLSEAGYKVRAVDFGGRDGFDLADFCTLHENNSYKRLIELPDLAADTVTDDTVTDDPGSDRQSYPDLGDMLITDWAGDVRHFRSGWYRYESGCWIERPRVVGNATWPLLRKYRSKAVATTKAGRVNVDDYLQHFLYAEDEDIDQGDDYVNLKNGLLNLLTYEIEPHQRDLFLTAQLPFEYDPDASCPRWNESLTTWLTTTDGKPDSELRSLVQEYFGYSLTADTSYQTSAWLLGQPASGKSTLLDVLRALLGNAQVAINLSTLATNQYQLADLPGKRVIVCTESATNSLLADNYYKMLVSGDELPVRQIRQRNFRFKPQGKVWWAMNEAPRNLDRSGAVDRRIMIVPFNRTIPVDERDLQLTQKLCEELPGVFNWALAGLKRLTENGRFTVSTQSTEAGNRYQNDNDLEQSFVNDWCDTTDPNAETPAGELYQAYQTWCKQSGCLPKQKNRVARDWERLGIMPRRTNRERVYTGVKLSADALRIIHESSAKNAY